MRVVGQRHTPAALLPAQRPGAQCTGGWVGPRSGKDGCEKSDTQTVVDPQTVQTAASSHDD